MEHINIKSFGPIAEADIAFGDFTLLVGPQASGKSLFLQLIKLINDKEYIFQLLGSYGYIWSDFNDILELYYGENMAKLVTDNTLIKLDGSLIGDLFWKDLSKEYSLENTYYIPAQRVLTLQNGWPKPFNDYTNDSFVLKNFSENLRRYLDSRSFSPQHLQADIMYANVFYNGTVELDTSELRKKFVLNIDNNRLPYLAWSAGQKEFMPLLLQIDTLKNILFSSFAEDRTVIIEEPEMGLHPGAIKMIIAELLELMHSGYKVIVSTHSPILLEFAWAVKILKENNASPAALYELFEIEKSQKWDDIFAGVLGSKTFKTYFFDRKNDIVIVKDISSLDADSNDPNVSEWGGLSSFSSKASEIVSKNVRL